MNVVDVQRTVKLSLPVADHHYTGEEDNCRFRNGSGEESWKKEKWQQKYTGQFLHDCIHTYGQYIWHNIDVKQHEAYEGNFYVNNLEGYGRISYRDGQTFEGLFKDNNRFGPGILTHTDGTQDVGLWLGTHLVRLNQSPTNEVPSIANSVKGKAYLLNYKNLIRINEKKDDPALEILKALNANEAALARKNELYSKFVRNPRSTFFNRKMYDDSYFTNNDDWVIKVIETYDPKGAPVYSKVAVTHLIAWNNEKLAVKFMRHAFKHRNLETTLSFNISSIFTGERQAFRPPGREESLCLQFLQSCCVGNDQEVMICNHDLYPDLTDFRGNNGVIFAAVNDCCKVIKTLTTYGANIDHMNDDCITALIISILRYIAQKYDVTNWELAFLPPVFEQTEFEPNIQAWRTKNKPKQNVELDTYQVFLFDLRCKKPTENLASKRNSTQESKLNLKQESRPDTRRSTSRDPRQESRRDVRRESKRDTIRESKIAPIGSRFKFQDARRDSREKKLFLEKIFRTIDCLLNCGSKPNYGDCPFPPLILAIFARSPDIVDSLLQHGADTNIRTAYHIGSLTPLHIVASLTPTLELTEMARHLILNGANPNLISNEIHWKHENNYILAGSKLEVKGKTPLHLLCMRYDFIEDIDDHLGSLCSLFINFGADPNAIYLGHTPLTLALLRGNITLMYNILDTGLVNPNEGLGNEMGAPLTVLILNRYENILPLAVCQEIYETLLEFYANPLNDIPNFGNSVEFCEAENRMLIATNEKGKETNHQLIIEMLKQTALFTLLKRIYKNVVQNIYIYHIECRFEHPIFEAIVKYLNWDITEYYLQVLLDHDLIFPSKTFCYELFEYIGRKRGKKLTIDDMVDDLDFNKTTVREKQFHFLMHRPELDPNDTIFKACFQCFHRRGKTLVRCPMCQMVYFCSHLCNLRNYRRKDSKHPCRLLFYNDELQKGEEESIFDQFRAQRDYMIANDPHYFDKLRQYDKDMTRARHEKREEVKRDTIAQVKEKKKHKLPKKDKSSKRGKSSERAKHGKNRKRGKGGKRGKDVKRGKDGERRKDGKEKKDGKKSDKGGKTVSPSRQVTCFVDSATKVTAEPLAVSDSFRQTVSDICDMYDERYFAMFMPYCLCMDGQLYYKFDNCSSYLQMTYSNI